MLTERHVDNLEGGWLQPEPGGLGKSEHYVHILHCLSRGAFDEVVDCRAYMDITIVQLEMQKRLVRVHDFFERYAFIRVKYERGCRIVFLEQLPVVRFGDAFSGPCVHACEYPPCEIPPERDEVHDRLFPGDAPEIHSDLSKVLVGEQLVDGDVVVPVAEMRGLSRFLPCTGRSRDGAHVHLVVDEPAGCKREQGKLDGRGEAARIGYVVGFDNLVPGAFAQPVYEMPACIVPVQTEVVAEVDYPAVAADIVSAYDLP